MQHNVADDSEKMPAYGTSFISAAEKEFRDYYSGGNPLEFWYNISVGLRVVDCYASSTDLSKTVE